MERPVNDNNGMRMEKFFHRVVVGVSAALILYGVILAGTMIYSARQEQAPVGDADFQALVAEQQGEDEPFPQMHPVPEFIPKDKYMPSETTDVGKVSDGQKDVMAMPLSKSADESTDVERPDPPP
ncbi:MAG: hypothetical protein IPH06_00460 [Alphaproteobacteria bacterium]|nr:hypothetical protein [Alphaproteobacteria bacterium]